MAGKYQTLVVSTVVLFVAATQSQAQQYPAAHSQQYPAAHAQQYSAVQPQQYSTIQAQQYPAASHSAPQPVGQSVMAAPGCNSGCGADQFAQGPAQQSYFDAGYRQGQGCGCGNRGCGGCAGSPCQLAASWKDKYIKARAEMQLQAARNRVWPQPFACRDRSLYYSILQTNIDSGWSQASTLAEHHFDPDTNELNVAGESKLQVFMQTAPEHRRTLKVFQARNTDIDARMASVRNVVDRWYGHMGETIVAATTVQPHGMDSRYLNAVNDRYLDALPVPVIQAAVGSSIKDQ